MSIEELDLLEEDFEREVVDLDVEVRLMCTIRMQRQSLLVIRRICCQVNHGHPHFFYLLFLYENGIGMMQDCQVYGVDNIVQHNIDNRIVINTFLLILEQMTGFDPKLLPRQSFNIFINALRVVSHLLAFMARIPGYGGREELSYTNLLTATKFIGTIAKCFPNPAMMSAIEFHSQDYFEVGELISVMGEMMGSSLDDQYHGFAKIVYDLVFVLESMSPQLNNQEKQQIELHLSHYIRNYFLERSTSVLHAGVFGLMKFRSSANLKTIKLILRLGADPNAINENGQTPLHWLAEIIFVNSGEYMPVFQALVDAGVHLDIAEDDGETVLDILKEYLMLYKDEDVANYFSSQIHKVFPLSCYCARAIRRHGIQFDGDRIPLHLQPFVSRHSNR